MADEPDCEVDPADDKLTQLTEENHQLREKITSLTKKFHNEKADLQKKLRYAIDKLEKRTKGKKKNG
jgi:thermostable 8-oxoguanine DNA glycosylase